MEASRTSPLTSSGFFLRTSRHNFSASSTNDRRGISFNGRTAVSADHNDGYLRLNDAQGFTNGVFTPGVLRVDGGIF